MKIGTLKAVWNKDEMVFEDFEPRFSLLFARNMSYNEVTVKIMEKHGSRWYTIGEAKDGELIPKGKKKEYYILPTDQYGQPDGNVNTVLLTKLEAIQMKNRGVYLFDNYISATYRAMD